MTLWVTAISIGAVAAIMIVGSIQWWLSRGVDELAISEPLVEVLQTDVERNAFAKPAAVRLAERGTI